MHTSWHAKRRAYPSAETILVAEDIRYQIKNSLRDRESGRQKTLAQLVGSPPGADTEPGRWSRPVVQLAFRKKSPQLPFLGGEHLLVPLDLAVELFESLLHFFEAFDQ